jgi:hypothetical protein
MASTTFLNTSFQFTVTILVLCRLIIGAHSLAIETAAVKVSHTSVAGASLHDAEKLQLTDVAVRRIASDKTTGAYAKYFAFPVSPIGDRNLARQGANVSCRSFPGDHDWPEDDIWDTFNALLGGALISTVPVGAPCYDSKWGTKDATKCANVINNYTNALFQYVCSFKVHI